MLVSGRCTASGIEAGYQWQRCCLPIGHQTPHDFTRGVVCKRCGKLVMGRIPSGGDGSALVPYPHKCLPLHPKEGTP